jgi:bifunctional enzyme CysN/CysC
MTARPAALPRDDRMAEPLDTPARPATPRALVRIVIVGHVDHGKSTLIGRLLHETGSLPEGKLESLRAMSTRRGMDFEWSFLLDSLQTERDQGITIDTSQIRFRTPSRDIVLIDAPGHTEFLRNMVTGAAQADAAVLIIDAAEGVRDQTRRHGYLLHLLGIRQVAVVINKMDRVDYGEARFRALATEITAHLVNLGMTVDWVIPISARDGDGVARRSTALAWYDGPTVLEALDDLNPAKSADELPLRLPVQSVYKFDDRRIIAGRIETGSLSVDDEIIVMPAGKPARIASIEAWPQPEAPPLTAGTGRSVGITLDREIFVDRGDILAPTALRPKAARRLRARVFWLQQEPLAIGDSVTVRIGTAEARGTIAVIEHSVDPGRLSSVGTQAIAQNHVGEIEIALTRPLAADPHAINPRTGRVVLEAHGRIAGGGLVLSVDTEENRRPSPANVVPVASSVMQGEKAQRFGHVGAVVWLTGLPGAGKSTLAKTFERKLFERGGAPVLLDGDSLRAGLNADLGFSPADRSENIRRIAEVAAHLKREGFVAIVAAVSPAAADRAQAREIVGERFYEVHVAAPLAVCEARDPKGHYRRARAGEIAVFTGVSAPYEVPEAPDLSIPSDSLDASASAMQLDAFLEEVGVIWPEGRVPEPDVSI